MCIRDRDETIYTSDILTIDEEQTLSDVQKAYTQAINGSPTAQSPFHNFRLTLHAFSQK